MNSKALIPLVVGLGIAGLAAKLGLDFMKKAKGDQVRVVKLWTPTQDIRRGVAIDESMLQPLPFPASAMPAGALADVKKIVGRVPHTGAPAGVPILDSMLLPPGVKAGVQVPHGYRAVAVKVDESSGVDNHLEPGCHVDVVGVFTIRRNNRAETVAKTLLENVEVAAVGQRLAPDTPAPGTEKDGKGKRSKQERPPRAVTLLVRPQQVPALHLAEQKGKIKLSMRGSSDQGASPHHAQINESQLLGDGEPNQPTVPWDEKVSSFISSLWPKNEVPPPVPEPAPTPAPVEVVQAPPAPEWVMVIYNGDERRMVGWDAMDSFRPIELDSEGPNIFQDEPRRQPPISPIPSSQPARAVSGVGRTSKAVKSGSRPEFDHTDRSRRADAGADEPDAEPQSESEPEELFE